MNNGKRSTKPRRQDRKSKKPSPQDDKNPSESGMSSQQKNIASQQHAASDGSKFTKSERDATTTSQSVSQEVQDANEKSSSEPQKDNKSEFLEEQSLHDNEILKPRKKKSARPDQIPSEKRLTRRKKNCGKYSQHASDSDHESSRQRSPLNDQRSPRDMSPEHEKISELETSQVQKNIDKPCQSFLEEQALRDAQILKSQKKKSAHLDQISSERRSTRNESSRQSKPPSDFMQPKELSSQPDKKSESKSSDSHKNTGESQTGLLTDQTLLDNQALDPREKVSVRPKRTPRDHLPSKHEKSVPVFRKLDVSSGDQGMPSEQNKARGKIFKKLRVKINQEQSEQSERVPLDSRSLGSEISKRSPQYSAGDSVQTLDVQKSDTSSASSYGKRKNPDRISEEWRLEQESLSLQRSVNEQMVPGNHPIQPEKNVCISMTFASTCDKSSSTNKSNDKRNNPDRVGEVASNIKEGLSSSYKTLKTVAEIKALSVSKSTEHQEIKEVVHPVEIVDLTQESNDESTESHVHFKLRRNFSNGSKNESPKMAQKNSFDYPNDRCFTSTNRRHIEKRVDEIPHGHFRGNKNKNVWTKRHDGSSSRVYDTHTSDLSDDVSLPSQPTDDIEDQRKKNASSFFKDTKKAETTKSYKDSRHSGHRDEKEFGKSRGAINKTSHQETVEQSKFEHERSNHPSDRTNVWPTTTVLGDKENNRKQENAIDENKANAKSWAEAPEFIPRSYTASNVQGFISKTSDAALSSHVDFSVPENAHDEDIAQNDLLDKTLDDGYASKTRDESNHFNEGGNKNTRAHHLQPRNLFPPPYNASEKDDKRPYKSKNTFGPSYHHRSKAGDHDRSPMQYGNNCYYQGNRGFDRNRENSYWGVSNYSRHSKKEDRNNQSVSQDLQTSSEICRSERSSTQNPAADKDRELSDVGLTKPFIPRQEECVPYINDYGDEDYRKLNWAGVCRLSKNFSQGCPQEGSDFAYPKRDNRDSQYSTHRYSTQLKNTNQNTQKLEGSFGNRSLKPGSKVDQDKSKTVPKKSLEQKLRKSDESTGRSTDKSIPEVSFDSDKGNSSGSLSETDLQRMREHPPAPLISPLSSDSHDKSGDTIEPSPPKNRGSFTRRSDSYVADDDAEFDEFEYLVRSRKEVTFKKVEEVMNKDLFSLPDDYALAHCVAEDMNMGSGIAVLFRKKFKNVHLLLQQRQKTGGLAILPANSRYIYYLVTKKNSFGKPTYRTLWDSLKALRNHIVENKVTKLGIPTIGCGLDRLLWPKVKVMIEYCFRNVDIEILVCHFASDGNSPSLKILNCKVVHEPKHISEIDEYTIILFFTDTTGYLTEDILTLNEKFDFLRDFKLSGKTIGTAFRYDKYPKYILYGCIVKELWSKPFDFVALQNCVNEINKRNKVDKYEYVAIQALFDDNDDLILNKIINILRNTLRNVDVYVCGIEEENQNI